jgi:hypothetical protein
LIKTLSSKLVYGNFPNAEDTTMNTKSLVNMSTTDINISSSFDAMLIVATQGMFHRKFKE